MKSGIATDRLRAFPLQLTGEDDTDFCRQAVRAWKALVGMVGGKGGVPLFAAWAKAHINPLDLAIRRDPFLSAISHDLMETAIGAADRLPSGDKSKGN